METRMLGRLCSWRPSWPWLWSCHPIRRKHKVLFFPLVFFTYYLPQCSLPENRKLPSLWDFAECQTTGSRQRCGLPSARPRALGKNLAHGMPGLCRVPAVGKEGNSAKCLICRVLALRHSAKPAHVPGHARPPCAARQWG